jgi:hypothetical protein
VELGDEWLRKEIPINFRLGELTLFSRKIILFVQSYLLNDNREDISIPLYNSVQATFPIDGLLIRSKKVKEAFPKLSRERGWIQFVPRTYRRYYIDLSGTFESYVQKFSKKSLATIKRKVNRFKDYSGGEIKWQVYRNPEEMDEFYEFARLVSKNTYQERLLDAGLPESQNFKSKMISLAQQNQVRGFLLFDQKKPVAYLYCPAQKGHMLYEYLGYDPQYLKWSPGTILQWLALEKIFSEKNFLLFDFTEGESEHKRFFANGSVLCSDLYLFPPRFSYLFFICCYIGMDKASVFFGSLLDRMNLKKIVKKFVRKYS